MVRSIPEEYFVKYCSSEGTNIGATDSKQTWGICRHHEKILSDSYCPLEENLTHRKILKIKNYPGDNVTDCCAAILVYAKPLESYRYFNTNHLGYITNISDNTSNPIFHLWENNKYNEVTEFIKKLHIYDKYVMRSEELITYGYLVKGAMGEYRNILN